MPRPPIRVGLSVGGVGERMVDTPPVMGGGGSVGRGPDERVRELHASCDREQPGVGRGIGRRHIDVEAPRGTVEEDGVADRLGGRAEEEQLRVGGQPVEAPHVAAFDPSGDPHPSRLPEPASELGDAPCTR
jgi:hypothetical protein